MGLSATPWGDALTAGLKVEDKLIDNKRLGLVGNAHLIKVLM